MADDQSNGPIEKVDRATKKVADKLEPTDEDLQHEGQHGHGGSNGDSEAVVHAPTSS